MEQWLLQRLETQTGGFRTARYKPCKRCGAWTLEGTDSDAAGQHATVDPTPLTPQQEFHAAINHRRTYTIGRRPNGKPQIDDRCPYAVARHPEHLTVVPAHQCGNRYPTTRLHQTTQTPTDPCPF